ncbi:hypothetical protein ACLOJK_031008 [Asimina triloba]
MRRIRKMPRNQVTPAQGKIYLDQEREKRRAMLQKFLNLCSASKVKADTLLIESDLIEKAILDLIPVLHIKKMVVGTTKSNLRKARGKAKYIQKNAPDFCKVQIVCEGKEVVDQMFPSPSSPLDKAKSPNVQNRLLDDDHRIELLKAPIQRFLFSVSRRFPISPSFEAVAFGFGNGGLFRLSNFENEAANFSVEEEKLKTEIQSIESDIRLGILRLPRLTCAGSKRHETGRGVHEMRFGAGATQSETKRLRQEADEMVTSKGQICCLILEKQKKIAILEAESSSLSQVEGMIDGEAGNPDGMAHETNGKYKDLLARLELAKTRLEETIDEKSKQEVENSKIKQIIEQLKHRLVDFPPALQAMDTKALQEECKALSVDKAGEMEYLQSLKERIEQVKLCLPELQDNNQRLGTWDYLEGLGAYASSILSNVINSLSWTALVQSPLCLYKPYDPPDKHFWHFTAS